ncbi:MAG: lipopolysaccharide transport periplasmic protein LptA [Gammaproteobacteria bacterium]|nr:lipopolysaccharide transport periplasmic protein LptA [Gammaproteobacteria bacterium]
MKKPFLLRYILFFLCCFQVSAFAVSQQNIHIKADHMQLNVKLRRTIYIGHVLIKTQTTQLEGQQITIQRDQNDQVSAILDVGDPAYYSDQPQDPKQKPTLAHAKMIEYYPQKHLAILKGEAFAKQGENVIQAPLIHYDTKNGLLTAFGNKETQVYMDVIADEDGIPSNSS